MIIRIIKSNKGVSMVDNNEVQSSLTEDGLTYLLEKEVEKFDVDLLGVDFSTWETNNNGLYEIELEIINEEDEASGIEILEFSEQEMIAMLRAAQQDKISFEAFVIQAITYQMNKTKEENLD